MKRNQILDNSFSVLFVQYSSVSGPDSSFSFFGIVYNLSIMKLERGRRERKNIIE